jgi:hypothetical protein
MGLARGYKAILGAGQRVCLPGIKQPGECAWLFYCEILIRLMQTLFVCHTRVGSWIVVDKWILRYILKGHIQIFKKSAGKVYA